MVYPCLIVIAVGERRGLMSHMTCLVFRKFKTVAKIVKFISLNFRLAKAF